MFSSLRRRSSWDSGSVRRMPISPYIIRCAAPIPVSSEICAFQPSTGSGARNSRRPLAVAGDNFLVRDRQVDAAAFEFALLAQLADLAQQLQRLRRRTGIEILLYAGVVELRARLHQRALAGDVRAFARSVDLDRPEQRRPHLVGQQRRGALGKLRRVQRRALVRRVERLAALARLDVDRVAGLHERRDVGDRVVHGVAVAVALDVQRLVEIHRVRRIDRDELDLGPVQLGQPRVRGRRQRSLQPPRPGTPPARRARAESSAATPGTPPELPRRNAPFATAPDHSVHSARYPVVAGL